MMEASNERTLSFIITDRLKVDKLNAENMLLGPPSIDITSCLFYVYFYETNLYSRREKGCQVIFSAKAILFSAGSLLHGRLDNNRF
jgi:hypothetical protein